jgi:hypothetical protein
MWLYPLPALIAAFGFVYILFERPNPAKELKYGIAIIIVGTMVYLIRSFSRREWPFAVERT